MPMMSMQHLNNLHQTQHQRRHQATHNQAMHNQAIHPLSRRKSITKVPVLCCRLPTYTDSAYHAIHASPSLSHTDHDFCFADYHTRYVAIEVLYFGQNYCGLAGQTNSVLPTIEYALFEALQKARIIPANATWQELRYSRCGRTDKGVSALSQVWVGGGGGRLGVGVFSMGCCVRHVLFEVCVCVCVLCMVYLLTPSFHLYKKTTIRIHTTYCRCWRSPYDHAPSVTSLSQTLCTKWITALLSIDTYLTIYDYWGGLMWTTISMHDLVVCIDITNTSSLIIGENWTSQRCGCVGWVG